jgi:hypothetical protein
MTMLAYALFVLAVVAEAALLRSHVIAFKSVLPEAIVRMAGEHG